MLGRAMGIFLMDILGILYIGPYIGVGMSVVDPVVQHTVYLLWKLGFAL